MLKILLLLPRIAPDTTLFSLPTIIHQHPSLKEKLLLLLPNPNKTLFLFHLITTTPGLPIRVIEYRSPYSVTRLSAKYFLRKPLNTSLSSTFFVYSPISHIQREEYTSIETVGNARYLSASD